MKVGRLFLICLSLCCKISLAQKPAEVLEWMNTVNCSATNFYQEIPFEYQNNHIVIKVQIHGKEYDYIFDTGGYNNVTDEIQAINNFPVLNKQTVGSTNKMKAEVNVVRVDSLQIGNLVFEKVAALQMDYSKVPTFSCGINGGLIGASIIKKFIWQIDYSQKKIIITDRKDKLSGLAEAVKIPVTFNKRLMPFIDITVDERKENVMFDTGSGTLFSMTAKSAKKYKAAERSMIISGGATEGGNGLLRQNIYVFKAQSVQIGNLTYVNKPVVYVPTNNVNLVGNPVIKNFVVTLNFPENEMYFKAISSAPLEKGWKSFGFTLAHQNGKVKVSTIYNGFAAENAGLRLGDEIKAINGKTIDCTNYCDCLIALPELLAEKETVTLTIVKQSGNEEVTLKKEWIY